MTISNTINRMNRRRLPVPALILILLAVCGTGRVAGAEGVPRPAGTGRGAALEITTGMSGAFSFAQFGLVLPQFIDHFVIGVKARGMSSLTWATFINQETGGQVSFHPVVIAGILTIGGTGDLVANLLRPYGNVEILAGYSWTPYDSLIYRVNNLMGDNLTLGIFGTFGLEFFTAPLFSVFVESGGGFKTMKGDNGNPYLVAASWLGSGVTFRMGARLWW